MIEKAQAIVSLRPLAKWVLQGEEVQWMDTEQTQPTEAEITAEVARLQAEYEANEYKRKRAAAYPSIADQLDTIYHNGIDAWKAEIAAVKTEYPKP
jgi:hypothetical protein